MSVWTLLLGGVAVIFAFLLRGHPTTRQTLPSLKENPHPNYMPDFYPNGTDLHLPMGTMRYWMFGNPKGQRVVLIHGISTGSAVYSNLARFMANSGYHVLVFDLWGRGFSEAPAGYYDEAMYTTQVALLLQKVGWQKTTVVGLSLGGGIATSFSACYREMVENLVLICPAGLLDKKDLPIAGKLVQLPLVGKIVLDPLVRPVIIKAVEQFFHSARKTQLDDQQQKIAVAALHQFTHHPGFLRAFLGTVIDFPLHSLHERYRTVGHHPELPVLVLWGNQDTTVPFKLHTTLKDLVPQADIRVYAGGAHDIILSHGEQINKDIVQFLNQHHAKRQ
ncbi:Alpha/Beta hydrolase protein [Radiomyces spectabilis]|uniref:Alpha/Beta hydrolase protein n=1 Tax=Radiomyces spectabilis TaxID=64574 RepID=UPI00221E3B57|nr:Alpha/Beta hydrolase protein [Radiomyces spectabilis]KAI8367583.1 Alpha/Beta hydrolase protein [Radiomyces spectabilis]